MTHSDIKTKFLIEYDKANITSSYPSLTDYEIATLLDKAYYALINQKVTGNNPRQAGFESDNKAIEDIQPLIVTKLIPKVAEHSHVENDVTYNIPSDYLYYVQSKMKVGYNVNGQTTYSSTDVELVSHELAKKYMCTTHNKPWVEVPVCYIEDNEITALTDPILHTPGDLDLTYIKQFKKFALPIDPSEEPDPSTDPEVDPTDDPTIDPDTEEIVWTITVDAKTTTFYSKTNTAEVKVVCINNKGELGTYKSYINEDDNDGYITKVSENKFNINSSATDYRNIDITFVCDQDTSKKTTRTFQFKYYTSSVIPTPTPTPTSDEYVDLGLSVKWARYNMGASTPSGYGSYYIWGSNNPPIYNLSSGDSICGTMYDNATQNWGQNWRMPTNSQINELIKFCEFKVCILDGHTGLKATSKKNGNSIFLPFSGRYDTTKHGLEKYGFYWTGDVKNITQAIYVGVVDGDDTRKLYISAAIADTDKCCIRPITTSSGSSSSGCSGSSCSSNCANNSTGSSCSNCASSCSSSCKTQCDFNCAATCKSHCGGSCNDSCGGTCTYLSAGTGCSGCARSCYNRCYTSCSYACSNNCESSCVHGSK